ncbi:hypothetical protein BC938DRAFT_470783 [Jimgerdemannia flammicorona]|uniref:F-box domain-containing protein n=1 Tax=Jimgerdemannia flammicorona TaxID=994334 RepID=A0A433Q9F7_9FUNG|nr:hypothetical protein BC938DRAFT_470783 [Jimgerdemannia flammicorona]
MPQAPYVSPEVLEAIFELLVPDDKDAFRYDVLAASLTCRLWYAVGSYYFNDKSLQNLFESTDNRSHANLVRTRLLLAESQRLGVCHGRHVKRIHLCMTNAWFGRNSDHSEAVDCIADIPALTPNLTDVRLHLGVPHGGLEARLSFHESLKPYCANVERLHVGMKLFSAPHQKLADLIADMHKLTIIDFMYMDFTPELLDALKKCTGIKYVTFNRARIRDAHLCISHWPSLRSLEVNAALRTYCEELWEAVAKSCPLLRELIYTDPSNDEYLLPDKTQLFEVLAKCSKLKVLYVKAHPGIGSEFLAAAMRDGRALTHLTLRNCKNVVIERGAAWETVEWSCPWLEDLDLIGCGLVADVFVERVLERCRRICKIAFSEERDATWPVLLEAVDFVRGTDGVWKRPVVEEVDYY